MEKQIVSSTPLSRRHLLATLGGAGAVTALAACGGPTPGPATQAKAMSGPLVMWWPSATFDPAASIGGEIQKSFTDKNSGITVESVVQGSADTFKTQVAAGTPPDFYHTQSYWQTTWGVTGLNTQLDDYVKRSKVIKPEDVWPLKLKEVQHQGKTWALPYSIDSRVIYINADHYARSGFDVNKPPATWDDFEKTIPALTKQAGPGELSQFAFD
ncbi:MAG TPA: substrate-binding domain-containing protein, partial [Chloroflexota bacterium]|nr:substrate-binding domain-containing protein [Chloroflexota bacterium]